MNYRFSGSQYFKDEVKLITVLCDICLERYIAIKGVKCSNRETCRCIACPKCKKCSIYCADKEDLKRIAKKYQDWISEYELKILEVKKRLRYLRTSEKLKKGLQKKTDVQTLMDDKWEYFNCWEIDLYS